MTDYGVQPTGFVRKSLAQILAEIETANITEFGVGVIQTSESPLGQLNGIFAELVAKEWENAAQVYSSYDPDQAGGVRLDMLARLRLLQRASGETDEAFRLAITNAGRTRVDVQDAVRAIQNVPGVTYAAVFIAENGRLGEYTVDAGTVSPAIIGGDDTAIAEALRDYIVPGVPTFGNYPIESEIDGYCRTAYIVRPVAVPVTLVINVRTFKDDLGCPPPSTVTMRNALASMTFVNGEDVTLFKVRTLEKLFSTVEVLSFVGTRDDVDQSTNQPVAISFMEIATLAFNDIVVNASS